MLLSFSSGDERLLTQAVLADSLKRAPITDIVANNGVPAKYGSFSVPVTYKIAGQPVSTNIEVLKDYQRGAAISQGTKPLFLSSFKDFDVTVNGVKIDDKVSTSVFPGSYTIATTTKYFTVDGPDSVLLKSTSDAAGEKQLFDLKPKADAEGIKLFRAKVLPEINKCLASKTLKAGCALELPTTVQGATLTDGTVERTMTSQERTKLGKVVPKPGTSVGTTLQASWTDLGNVSFTVDTVKDGKRSRSSIWGLGAGLGTASIDTTNPALPVVWGSRP